MCVYQTQTKYLKLFILIIILKYLKLNPMEFTEEEQMAIGVFIAGT